MQKMIQIKELSFGYEDKLLFDNFSLEIEKDTFTTIIGSSGSGRNTLTKLIIGKLKNKAVYTAEKVFFLHYDKSSPKTVMEELSLNDEKVIQVAKKLKIENILAKKMNDLTIDQKQMIPLIKVILTKPSIIIFNSSLGTVNNFYKTKILNELKKIKSTIIHITDDIEDVFYGEEIIVLNEGKIVTQGKNEEVLETLNKPFILELSKRLKFYGLIDNVYYKTETLVNELWK